MRTASTADPNVLTLLSLKLLLLAFFILLTSLAEFQDDRARQVLESVNEAFNGQVEADRSYNIYSSALANLEEIEALFDEVGELFQSSLPAIKVESSADGSLVSFELRADTLFTPGSTDLRPGRWLMLRRLGDSLTYRGRAGLPYELAIVHGVAKLTRPGGANRARSNLARRRLGSLGQVLSARGLPDARLSVGLHMGAPDVVRFVLEIKSPAGPGGDGDGNA